MECMVGRGTSRGEEKSMRTSEIVQWKEENLQLYLQVKVMETIGLNSRVKTPEKLGHQDPCRAVVRHSQSHYTDPDPLTTSSAAWSFRVVYSFNGPDQFTTSRIPTTNSSHPTDQTPSHPRITLLRPNLEYQDNDIYDQLIPEITMAPKKNTTAATPASESWLASSQVEFEKVLNGYWSATNHQTKVIDVFLGFLVAVGAIQFLYFFLGSSNVSGLSTSPFQSLSHCSIPRTDMPLMPIALQRLPRRIHCDSWPVCPDWCVPTSNLAPKSSHTDRTSCSIPPHADPRAEQVAIPQSHSRAVCRPITQTNTTMITDRSRSSFADYIFGSLILHLFCVNYLN